MIRQWFIRRCNLRVSKRVKDAVSRLANDFRRARIFRYTSRRTVPLEFVVSIREKRRGTRATGVIALVYRRRGAG